MHLYFYLVKCSVCGQILAIIRPVTTYGVLISTRSSLGTHQNTWCCHRLSLRCGRRQSRRHWVVTAQSRSASPTLPPRYTRSTTFSSSTGLGAHNDETVSETWRSHICLKIILKLQPKLYFLLHTNLWVKYPSYLL